MIIRHNAKVGAIGSFIGFILLSLLIKEYWEQNINTIGIDVPSWVVLGIFTIIYVTLLIVCISTKHHIIYMTNRDK